jgi:hypothetical protein
MIEQGTMFDAWDRSSPEWVYSCPPGRGSQYRWRAHRVQRKTDKCLYVTRRSVTLEERVAGVMPPDEEKPYRLNRQWWERDGWKRHTDCRRSCLYARVGMERRPSPDEIAEENRRRREEEQSAREQWRRENPEEWARQQAAADFSAQAARMKYEEDLRRLFAEFERTHGYRPGVADMLVGGDSSADARTLRLSAWPCSRATLKAAYRRLAKETHPDRGGTAEAFRRVNEAYERLERAIA